ncbi:hypothetical protein [Corallococcus exercitus]|uniref:hypothetical protein n=1 Tax=Corallococcus exercitus TaxID=2316736 RepID=UPI0011C48D28|nr:hypothetical protein [Corallococcus exercitus]
MSFVLDDAPWMLDSVELNAAVAALEELAERLDTALLRREEVRCYAGVYQECHVQVGVRLYELLFGENSLLSLQRDLRNRLSRHLDRIATLQDDKILAFDVTIHGERIFAPSLAWAHDRSFQGEPAGCLTLSTAGRVGGLPVDVEGRLAQLHFVVNESAHVGFFRQRILDSADAHTLETLAASAFPQLCFVDDLWRGLHDFSRPYRDIRDEVVNHLSIFSDHGSHIFSQKQNRIIESGFAAHYIEVSPENQETLRDRRCREAREREFCDELLIFNWHSKIEPHQNRIHIHPGTKGSNNRVIVGILHEHLPLPRN